MVFYLSKKFLKQIEKNLGDEVEMLFRIGDQNAVEIPKELEKLLDSNKSLKAKWDSLTPGKKRSLVIPLSKAKSDETKLKRIIEIKKFLDLA